MVAYMKKLLPGITTPFVTTRVASAATVAYCEFNGSSLAAVGSSITDSVGGHPGTVDGGDLLFGSDPVAGRFLKVAEGGQVPAALALPEFPAC